MLKLKTWMWTLGLLFSQTFILCVLWNIWHPKPVYIRILETVFPGFEWLSLTSLILGLMESFLYGLYAAVSLVFIHNALHRKDQKNAVAIRDKRKAA